MVWEFGYRAAIPPFKQSPSRHRVRSYKPLQPLNHTLPLRTSALLARKLAQQLSHKLRALISLLLDLALTNSIQRPEQPHFLQVADEHLQVFCGFDLRGEAS
jgi:hypothetical protein